MSVDPLFKASALSYGIIEKAGKVPYFVDIFILYLKVFSCHDHQVKTISYIQQIDVSYDGEGTRWQRRQKFGLWSCGTRVSTISICLD